VAGAQAFLDGWERLLEELGQCDLVLEVAPLDERGELRGTVRLDGDRRLGVYLRLEFREAPRLVSYSLQLLDDRGASVLRYDNSPYHGDLPGAPHHLHKGEEIVPVMPEPSLRTMLAAVRDAIER